MFRCKSQRISDDDCRPLRIRFSVTMFILSRAVLIRLPEMDFYWSEPDHRETLRPSWGFRVSPGHCDDFMFWHKVSSQSQPRRVTVWRLLFWFEVVTGRPISSQSGWRRAGVTVREEERRQMWRGGGCRQQRTSCNYPDHTFPAPFPPFLHANSTLKPANFLLFWLQNITGTQLWQSNLRWQQSTHRFLQ